MHILVVDDDKDIRDIVARILERAGFAVDVAEDGEYAWDAVGLRHYDLIITDEKMPRLSGSDLLVRLRRGGVPVPVLMMTGVAASVKTEAGPPDGFLAKPFAFPALLVEANRLLCTAA